MYTAQQHTAMATITVPALVTAHGLGHGHGLGLGHGHGLGHGLGHGQRSRPRSRSRPRPRHTVTAHGHGTRPRKHEIMILQYICLNKARILYNLIGTRALNLISFLSIWVKGVEMIKGKYNPLLLYAIYQQRRGDELCVANI